MADKFHGDDQRPSGLFDGVDQEPEQLRTDLPRDRGTTPPASSETQRFDTVSIERKLSEELGISMEKFRDLTGEELPFPESAGTPPEPPAQEPWEPETPDAPIEEQISRKVQEKVEAEDAMTAARRAQEESRMAAKAAGAGAPPKKAKKTKQGGCLGGLLYFLFIVGASLLLATVGWVCANDVLGLIKDDVEATVEIPENYTLSEVAEQLGDKGIINYPWLFKLYAGFSNADEKIAPGSYEIRADLDYRAIVYAMRASSSYRSTVWVTIPEGYTLDQILETLADSKVAKLEDLKQSAANDDFDYEYLQDIPKGEKRLEGFLYPDTYEFYINENPKSALNKMLYTFDSKFTAEWREKAADMGYSIRDIVTVASMIEKESAGAEESATIASVIYNRLNSSDFPKLQIDATIQYFLPERKENLSLDDLAIDNPYNTYLYEGLPPGPIASPGFSSLKAALYPADTKYYFYILDTDGTHHFSKTKREHDEFKASLSDSQ